MFSGFTSICVLVVEVLSFQFEVNDKTDNKHETGIRVTVIADQYKHQRLA